jgi:hypothetical protein
MRKLGKGNQRLPETNTGKRLNGNGHGSKLRLISETGRHPNGNAGKTARRHNAGFICRFIDLERRVSGRG